MKSAPAEAGAGPEGADETAGQACGGSGGGIGSAGGIGWGDGTGVGSGSGWPG
jgi:hypothetical protein